VVITKISIFSQDFDNATIQRQLRKALSIPPAGSSTSMDKSRNLEIDVLSVNSWTMHAQVADSFTNEHNNVFLAGDAAHRFPPAG
jgi:2-polyprenyl-6-methoxyphenol hydroxylase-like FAD-dependent oxidoreductase